MAVVKPFRCIRPEAEAAAKVAALPYDVYSRQEAALAVAGNPLSFLNIDRAETQFPETVDTYDRQVYQKARELLDARLADHTFLEEQEACYYLYELTMEGRCQTGIVAASSVDDYLNEVVKKHEKTREDKELDRICHVDATDAQTGPIFLAYRSDNELNQITRQVTAASPLYDFTSEDEVRHRVWKIDEENMLTSIENAFAKIPCTYIADGHHRAASAVKVACKRRAANKDEGSGHDYGSRSGNGGNCPYDYFLSVLFPDDQLKILPYNRVVKDLNGLSEAEFLARLDADFDVQKLGRDPYQPERKGTFGMYLNGDWYALGIHETNLSSDPVRGLDVSLLQDYLLAPVLGIGDPRTDKRIDFIGGIRGLKELERRVNTDMKVAFSMYPTTMEELFTVADAGCLMPPKSTWFEPKLRSGLFIHRLT